MKKILTILFLLFIVITGFFLFRHWIDKISETIEAHKPASSEIETYSPYAEPNAIPLQKPCPSGNCKG